MHCVHVHVPSNIFYNHDCIVSVNRPPNMLVHPEKDIWYKPGESMPITCVADGIPKPM